MQIELDVFGCTCLVGNVCDVSATCQQCRVKSPIFCWQGKCANAVTWALYYENSQKCKEKITNKLLKDLFINIVMSMTCISNILPLKHIIWSVWYLFTGKYASMSRHVSPTCRDASVWHVIWTLQLTCQLPTFPTKFLLTFIQRLAIKWHLRDEGLLE